MEWIQKCEKLVWMAWTGVTEPNFDYIVKWNKIYEFPKKILYNIII